jgi:methyltransferase (TIGR00027 family)
MKTEAASRTAQYMAFFRAMETARPQAERIFTDPYATAFLDAALKLAVTISALPFARKLIENYIQRRIPGAYSSGIARTGYIDDLLKQSVNSGIKQVVILGAGFDTRALRLDFMKSTPVIEIDHPNTAELKIKRLKEVLGSLPENVKYYQIDFNKQSLQSMAEERQLNFSIPTTVIWEGVTNYLSVEAVNSTFRFIENFAPGSHVIFTYVNQLMLDKPDSYFGGAKLLHDLAAIEEHWTFGLNPESVPGFLKNFQLTLIEDFGAAEYRKRYLPQRQRKGYEFYRVAFAKRN